MGRCQPGRELVRGSRPAALSQQLLGGKGRGYFRGHFCGAPSQPSRTWDGLVAGGPRARLVTGIRDPQSCLSGTLWPTLLWAQSPPELPLRPRRVPPNRPGWQQLTQGVGLGASQQMPPLGSFLFQCPQLPPSVHPTSGHLYPPDPPGHWGLAQVLPPGLVGRGWRPGKELWYVSGFGVRHGEGGVLPCPAPEGPSPVRGGENSASSQGC